MELAIPSDVQAIERVVDAVVERCVAAEYPRRLCALNVPVALTEALANAILRGNRGAADKQVRVRACVQADQLVLEVEDEGAGFDLAECTADPTEASHLELEGGRGLFLMSRLMDRVERYAPETRGNVVRMTLHRP